MFAKTPSPPYFAVVFTSLRTSVDNQEYQQMAQEMEDLAQKQNGYLGIESARDSAGNGITVSYWKDLESIRQWKAHTDHQVAQNKGRAIWYQHYHVRICEVKRDYKIEG